MYANQHSTELFNKAKILTPGGVHSPVRSFSGLPIEPIFVEKADGPYIFDVDGHSYIDFCMSFGPLVLGHNNHAVNQAIHSAVDRGVSYGTAEPYSLQLAEFIISKIPYIDQIRFVNSGTEAVMTALRLARGVSGREKIVKFHGCYHGHSDSLLIKAGSGLAQMSQASSAGVTEGVSKDTIVLELNDEQQLNECFEKYKDQIAALIIEPLPANYGLLPQEERFLKLIRKLTKEQKTILIMDEVISGFRVGFGGMCEQLNIVPDLVTYGKIIGGGLPVGAVAGPRNIMEHLAPKGNVYQAGTLSANPLAMAAGLATLKQLTSDFYADLEQKAQNIVTCFSHWLKEGPISELRDLEIVHKNSLFWFTPKNEQATRIYSPNDFSSKLSPLFEVLFMNLVRRGIYLSPNAYEINFISSRHEKEELEKRLWS